MQCHLFVQAVTYIRCMEEDTAAGSQRSIAPTMKPAAALSFIRRTVEAGGDVAPMSEGVYWRVVGRSDSSWHSPDSDSANDDRPGPD